MDTEKISERVATMLAGRTRRDGSGYVFDSDGHMSPDRSAWHHKGSVLALRDASAGIAPRSTESIVRALLLEVLPGAEHAVSCDDPEEMAARAASGVIGYHTVARPTARERPAVWVVMRCEWVVANSVSMLVPVAVASRPTEEDAVEHARDLFAREAVTTWVVRGFTSV